MRWQHCSLTSPPNGTQHAMATSPPTRSHPDPAQLDDRIELEVVDIITDHNDVINQLHDAQRSSQPLRHSERSHVPSHSKNSAIPPIIAVLLHKVRHG